jgi:hypothetical protein
MIMKTKEETSDDVFLTRERFEKDLETCLVIIDYPEKGKPYYLCEHTSYALTTRKVKVYLI